jgi:hypothetical protein
MKHYLIDELRPQDYDKIKTALDKRLEASGVEGLYWLEVKSDLLTDPQAAHTDCRPFYFAICLEPDRLSCELLIRTRQSIRCDCMAYATERQRNWLIQWADGLFEQLGLLT